MYWRDEQMIKSLHLVENLEEVKLNIIQFNIDLKTNEEMRKRFLPYFTQWYYIYEIDMFAPSKFIGYKEMDGDKYNNKDGTGADGRKTEAILKKWFIKKNVPDLLNELNERIGRFGKIKKNSQIHILISEEQLFREPVSRRVIQEDLESEDFETNGPQRLEGKAVLYFGTKYERDAKNRKIAIQFHGTTCVACGFNFEDIYGERGRDYIEVHHIKPLSTLDSEMTINPEKDLVPLCSNCHRMVHRKKDDVLSVEDLQKLLNN